MMLLGIQRGWGLSPDTAPNFLTSLPANASRYNLNSRCTAPQLPCRWIALGNLADDRHSHQIKQLLSMTITPVANIDITLCNGTISDKHTFVQLMMTLQACHHCRPTGQQSSCTHPGTDRLASVEHVLPVQCSRDFHASLDPDMTRKCSSAGLIGSRIHVQKTCQLA